MMANVNSPGDLFPNGMPKAAAASIGVRRTLELMHKLFPDECAQAKPALNTLKVDGADSRWTDNLGREGDVADLFVLLGAGSRDECEILLRELIRTGRDSNPTPVGQIGASEVTKESNVTPPSSHASHVGVAGAVTLLRAIHGDACACHARLLSAVETNDAGTEWSALGHVGDAIDLFARVSGQTRADAEGELEHVLSRLGEAERAQFAPDAPPSLALAEGPFPVDALPGRLRNLVADLAEVFEVPTELPGAMILGAVSAALGRGLRLNSVRGLSVFGNIFVLAGFTSGFGKSVLSGFLFKPLHECQHELLEEHKHGEPVRLGALASIQKRLATAEQSSDRAGVPKLSADELAALRREEDQLRIQRESPRILVEDATTEALAVLLAKHGECLASITADARTVIQNLKGKYGTEGRTNEDLYLKCYSSEPFFQDRIGRGALNLKAPVLTITWMTQPDYFDEVFATQGLQDSGFMCRVLSVRVEASLLPDGEESSVSPEVLATYGELMRSLLKAYNRHEGEPYLISPTPSAAAIMRTFARGIRQLVATTELAHVASFPARWAENAWRIALVLHAATHGDSAHAQPVSEQTAESAVRIMTWFAAHQHELLMANLKSKDNEKFAFALDFVNQSPGGVRPRDLFRKRQALFRTITEATRILNALEEERRITSQKVHKGYSYHRLVVPPRAGR